MTTKITARPTTYKGIRMRSRLEAGFAAWLDRWHFEWEYEPCAFASEDGQYLPDFRLTGAYVSWLPETITAYVEVKPEPFANFASEPLDPTRPCEEQLLIAQQADIIAASEPEALLFLMQPHGCYVLVWDRPDDKYRARLPIRVDLIRLAGGRAGFAWGLGFGGAPWADEYWKPRPS